MKFPHSSRRKHSNSSRTSCPTSSCLWSHFRSCCHLLPNKTAAIVSLCVCN
ncbi:hypothetical protein MUK42_31060 [Musa troglodytarum]|uniref:Uncharacterized protein n=1 Tax=Musa troglodytarum TaxID=320322 RepID=A0A9E7GJL2_9LILI|nr:hypothetical protein MUK42_31060 [Musa troglodytarum]